MAPVVLHLRPRTPIGRGTALRARSVGVQVAPRTPDSWPATLLVWRSACRADERGSKPRQVAIPLRATRFAGFAPSSEALAEEDHLGVAQPAERPLREREAAGAKPATQSILLRAARFAGFAFTHTRSRMPSEALAEEGCPSRP